MKGQEQYMNEMKGLEDYAHFRAKLVEMSPESFTLQELQGILGDMIRSKVAMEDAMREHFESESPPFPLTHRVPFRHDLRNGERRRAWDIRRLSTPPSSSSGR